MLQVLLLVLGACSSAAGGSRFERHFDPGVWTNGLLEQGRHPAQYAPELGLALLTPTIAIFDRDLSEDAFDHSITGGDTKSGDQVAAALGGAVLLEGGLEWISGDSGMSLEAGVESILATEVATEALKRTVGRHRPQGRRSTTSFPSGHASFSFASATFLARQLDELYDTRWGYALMLPATYVALDRVEGARHFPSDVAAGALLGMFVTNWVVNAHYGDPAHGDVGIFPGHDRAAWQVGPMATNGMVGLAFSLSF